MLSEQSQSSSSPAHVLAISPGVAIGAVRLFKPQATTGVVANTKIGSEEVDAEQKRLHQALESASQEISELSSHVSQTIGSNEAAIFEAQQLMLSDPDFVAEIEGLITQQRYSAAFALQEAAEHQAQELEGLDNALLAARAADIRDVAARAIRHLLRSEQEPNAQETLPTTPVIIVANDLTPSDTAKLDPKMILGICTVVGGPTTHAAIIARALEIPAIAGFDPHLLDLLHDGQHIAINGTQGLLYVELDSAQELALSTSMKQQQAERARRRMQAEAQWRNRVATTSDGVPIQVFANVGDIESARAAAEAGAEGIGLLRTEFLFGGRAVFPDEQEQFESYVALFRAFASSASLGKTIIARTLDAGADKPFPALETLIGSFQEANPALGLRGARIHLVHEELLRQQLRALLRAGAETQITLYIMFPMIATLEEVRRLRAVYTEVRQELQGQKLRLPQDTLVGIMVETPAAAVMADVLAKEVDFFSIGANDLFQYTMAVDRTNSRVTSMFGVLEPAVWRLIKQIIDAGKMYGKPVALCGELAADSKIGPLLAGLGVQELSMSPPAIVRLKAAIHEHTMEYWQQYAMELLNAETSAEVQTLLQSLSI